MKNKNVIISCIIPVFNAEKTIVECIDSLINQSFDFWEAIFIDDGSTDSSAKIISEYSLIDLRIRLIKQQNKKQAVARNNGIKHAKGKYIAFLDADDIAYPERFKLQFDFLECRQDVTILGGGRENIDIDTGKKISYFSHPESNRQLKNEILKYSPFTTSTVMVRKSFFSDMKFHPNSTPVEDYRLWLEAAEKKEVVFWNLTNVLVKYRIRKYTKWSHYARIIEVKTNYLFKRKETLKGVYHALYVLLSFFKNNPLNKG